MLNGIEKYSKEEKERTEIKLKDLKKIAELPEEYDLL